MTKDGHADCFPKMLTLETKKEILSKECVVAIVFPHLYKARFLYVCPPGNTTMGIGHITAVIVLTTTEIRQWE